MGLYLFEQGPENAETILFIHGGGGAGWMWRPQLERLSEYHCLAPDLPEQGNSVNEKPFSIDDSARRLADLIRTRAHQGKAHIVGLSEGAQIALALLAIAPERVDRAVISSALVRPIPGGGMITPGMVAWSYRLFMAPLNKNEGWIRLNMKYAAGVPDAYYPEFRKSFQEMTESGFVNLMVENQRFRLPAGLERATAPALVVCGRGEYGAMRQSVRDIAAALPNGHGYEVHHPGKMSLAEQHNWNLTAPDLFTQMLRAWLTASPLPTEIVPG